MRILQVSSARHFGGGERHLVDLINGLAERGHELFVAGVPNSPLLAALASLPKQNIFHLPFGNALDIAGVWKLAKFARANQIQIIHAHVGRDYPLAALTVGRAGGAKLVITRHVLFPLGRIHRLTRRRVSRVIAVSEAVAAALRKQNIFDERTIRVVRHGINLGRFANVSGPGANRGPHAGSPRGVVDATGSNIQVGSLTAEDRTGKHTPLRVGMLGELSPVKGQKDFVRAAAIVAAQNESVQFVIAGKDNSSDRIHRRELNESIKSCGVEDQVTVIESDIDVPEFLKTLDVFVSASHSEAFGLAIVEAMAAGIPVVATTTEGAAEIIKNEQDGLLTPIGDAAQIAEKINRLLSDAALCDSLARNARQAVISRFALDRMIEETENIYREALQ